MNADATVAARTLELHADPQPHLIERLEAFGLIEPNGRGSWRLTECCKASLSALQAGADTPPKTSRVLVATAVHAWRPRKA